MRAMRPDSALIVALDGSVRRSRVGWLRVALLTVALVLVPAVRAQPIAVTFGGGGFASGPSVKQVRTLVRQILDDRVSRFSRCDVRLDGISTRCDMYVSLQRARIQIGDQQLMVRAIHGRIPIGNFMILLQGRLRWPDSFQVKDLTVEFHESDLTEWLATTMSIRSAQAVAPGGTCRVDLTIPGGEDAGRRLMKRLLDVGLSVDGRGRHTVVRDLSTAGRLLLRGSAPTYLGDKAVTAVGSPVGTPAGRLACSCSLVVSGGNAFIESPENYLVAEQFSRALDQLQQEMENVFVCRSFVNGAYLTATGGLVVEGLALVSGMDHIDRLQSSSRSARVNGRPTLDVNPYR